MWSRELQPPQGKRVRHDDRPCSFVWGDRDKDIEILALRHQITVLERQLGADTKVGFAPEDRALLAALLTSMPREVLRRPRSWSDRTPSWAGTEIC